MVDTMNIDIIPDNDEEEFVVDFGEIQQVRGGAGTDDFNTLTNRPKYNGQVMTGDTDIPQVPVKTSELTNDGADGTSTYVEANGLSTVATSGSYDDLENKPTIPTVNDATLTITQNGTSKGTFTANDSDDTTIELSDTTYSNFVGTDGNTGGAAGLVPAPATSDADKFLKSDGTWATAGGGGGSSVKVLTTADYNFPQSSPELIAGWLLPVGQYIISPYTDFMPDGNSYTYKSDQRIGVLVLNQVPDNTYSVFISALHDGEKLFKVQANGSPAAGYPHDI